MAAALVCPEERGLHVVPHQAGGPEVRLALQKRRRNVNAFTPQLEAPLFVLRESKLMYFENDSEEKLKGTIDIRRAK